MTPFEVWATDQSGAGGKLYVYNGADLNDNAAAAVPEVIDLDGAVSDLCREQTGSAPVRAHMLAFNPAHTHAILSYVASGHVVFLDAATRAPLSCIDVGQQAHAAFPSPDSRYVVVANQNGKLLQRISTDYASDTFTLDNGATLDLATCRTPSGALCQDDGVTQVGVRPDNAPICPVIESGSRLVFATLRGGGMFVVDATATPMRIIAEYDRATVQPEGCGGIQTRGKMYINSGNANPPASHLYAFSLSELAGAGPPAEHASPDHDLLPDRRQLQHPRPDAQPSEAGTLPVGSGAIRQHDRGGGHDDRQLDRRVRPGGQDQHRSGAGSH